MEIRTQREIQAFNAYTSQQLEYLVEQLIDISHELLVTTKEPNFPEINRRMWQTLQLEIE